MNKKIIFSAVGVVSLIGGVAAGLIHRSNKRYRRVLDEAEHACEVLKETNDLMDDMIRCLESSNDIFDDLDYDDDEEYDFCGTNERCCAYTDRILKEIEEGTYSE